jgi:UDP-N-acetylglucosamine 4-epimerase
LSNRLETIQLELQENSYNWLVTGAAGFIGSHLVQFLLDNNQNVLAVDNFSTGLKKNIDFLNRYHQSLNNNSKFIFSESDIRDYDQCLLMTKGIDFVLHQAAIGSVPRSIKDPLTSHDSNINGFLNIIQSSKENKVQNLVYASSSSVYGDSEVLPKKESHQGNLLSPYALTKSVNESYAMVFSEAYDFNSIGLRYFNVFGLRQDPNGQYAAVIPRWINAIMKGEDFFINGDGSTTRDFCYINNAVQANIIAAIPRTNEALNRVYNIAANHQITLIELYKIISQNISMNLPSIEVNRPIFRDFRPGDILHSRADIELAEELLGYEVSMSVEDGLKDLIKLECEKYE